jgi:hypothetical protein
MRLINTSILVLALSGIFFNCKDDKKDDKTTQLLLLYITDQASGNCATINKNTTGTIYSATGTTIPKGGCNAATLQTGLYTTSSSEAATALGTFYDALKAVYDTDTTNCSSMSTSMTTAKSNISTTTITATQTALTSGSSGCASVGTRIVSGKVSSVFICKDDSSITSYKARDHYLATSSVATDMSAALADRKTSATAVKSTTGFTDTAIAAMKAYGATEATVLSSTNFYSWLNSLLVVNCAKGIVAKDANLKTYLTSAFGGSLSTSTGITTTDAASVVAVVVGGLNTGLTCGYGSGFTAVTTTGFVNAACPSTYTQY